MQQTLIRKLALPLSVLALFLTGCAETQLAVHTAKKLSTSNGDNAESKGRYKVGKPYQIKGVWYYPTVNYRYRETGIASWYGPNFHGRKTANGEIFDMNTVSAAHRTLPMPSVVRVINLNNGRAIKVKINDRGPFAHGRIIDLSRRAAQLLGFIRQGTTPVRVEILEEESRIAALQAQGLSKQVAAVPSGSVRVASLPGGERDTVPAGKPAPAPRKSKIVTDPDPEPLIDRINVASRQKIFIQAGAFVNRHRADVLKYLLEKHGVTRVVAAQVGKQRFYRVRIGPVASVSESDRILEEVIATGYPDARVVID